MKNNGLKIGDVVVLKDGDPIPMVIEEFIQNENKCLAKCVWMDINNEIIRGDYHITSLELEKILSFDNINHSFKTDDYVVLKCGDCSMLVEWVTPYEELSKITCSWQNTFDDPQVATFYATSLIPE